jgi:hypothetical protein
MGEKIYRITPKRSRRFYLLGIYAEQKQKDKVQELLTICEQKDPDWQKRREYREIVQKLNYLS